MDAPLRTFHGFLKQITLDDSDPVERILLETCLPRYEYTPTFENTELNSEREKTVILNPGEWPNLVDPETVYITRMNRRYSGLNDLPRGRYYTVSSDSHGCDHGTLENELLFYGDQCRNGLFAINDHGNGVELTNGAEVIDARQIFPTKSKVVQFICIHSQEAPNRFITESIRRFPSNTVPLERTPDGLLMACVFLSYRIVEEMIPRSLDLRYPDARNWLAEKCRSLNYPSPFKRYEFPIKNFASLFPALLGPDVGGNELTDEIGRVLRSMAVNALIYPSARSNSVALFEDNTLIHHWGWNLVDYRNASLEENARVLDARALNLLNFHDDIRILQIVGGKMEGTIAVTGLRERYVPNAWEAMHNKIFSGREKYRAAENLLAQHLRSLET